MSQNIFDTYWTLSIIRLLWIVFVILIVASFIFSIVVFFIGYQNNLAIPTTFVSPQPQPIFGNFKWIYIIISIILHMLGLLFVRLIFESIAVRFDTFNELQELNKKADWMIHINNDDK